MIAVHLAGYATRVVAAVDPLIQITVGLHREFEVAGRLVDWRTLEPITEGIELVLYGHVDRATVSSETGGSSPKEQESVVAECPGVWRVRSDSEGRFRARVGSPSVGLDVLTPGWAPVHQIQLESGAESDVGLAATPILRILDDETEKPIERVRIVGVNRSSGSVRWSGEFPAPSGEMSLPGPFHMMQWLEKDTLGFTVWASGYEPRSFDLSRPTEARVIEVRLRRGALAEIRGLVHRAGVPCAGAEVALVGHSLTSWRESDDILIDAATVDVKGRFVLGAAPGTAILRIDSDGLRYMEVVELPLTSPFDIDLDALASIVVQVVNDRGEPLDGHVVGLSGATGRTDRRFMDENGEQRFDALSPDRYTVMAPFVTTEHSIGADVFEEIILARGSERRITLRVPDTTRPRHLRVTVDGVADYGAWKARLADGPWIALEANGVVPLDLTTQAHWMQVTDGSDGRWTFQVPRGASDGHVVKLDAGHASYRGVVLDEHDQPVAGITLFATPIGPVDSERMTVSTQTDEQGGFTLRGLLPRTHQFRFREDADRSPYAFGDSQIARTSFDSDVPAGDDAYVEPRVARLSRRVTLAGTIQSGSDKPLEGLTIHVCCEAPSQSGRARPADGWRLHRPGSDGRFALEVLGVPICTVRVLAPEPGQRPLYEEVIDLSGEGPFAPLDIRIE